MKTFTKPSLGGLAGCLAKYCLHMYVCHGLLSQVGQSWDYVKGSPLSRPMERISYFQNHKSHI